MTVKSRHLSFRTGIDAAEARLSCGQAQRNMPTSPVTPGAGVEGALPRTSPMWEVREPQRARAARVLTVYYEPARPG